jgi:hypothetical protein
MNDLMEIHREAMRFVDEALRLRREGNAEGAREQFRKAWEWESRAAALAAQDVSLEPTRAVLHRSAATLALECGKLRAAERLIITGLSGNPPDEIADELRDLLVQVYFERPPKAPRRSLRGADKD